MAFEIRKIPEVEAMVSKTTREDFGRQFARMRAEVREMATGVRTIKPRTATSMAIIASDGGNNLISFDPFELQFVRVVDSYGEEICLDAVSPFSNPRDLAARQFGRGGTPETSLGRLMAALDVRELGGKGGLSWMIPDQQVSDPDAMERSWTFAYRDLCEWAALFDRVMNSVFATDTLLLRDGLLRAKLFGEGLFAKMTSIMQEKMESVRRQRRRRIFIVGVAKKSKVVQRYGQALLIEGVFPEGHGCYLKVPRRLEEKAYDWPEYARGRGKGESAGSLFLVRFGGRMGDEIWPVDVFSPHLGETEDILGCLLEDAKSGFPTPYYPLSLQRADGFAQVRELDADILEAAVRNTMRESLDEGQRVRFDQSFLFRNRASRRY